MGKKTNDKEVLQWHPAFYASIQKNLGRIFRKHNIVEYKSPKDYLSIDDFYKVYGYACFYKADTAKENQIRIEDVTITFVCHKYPRKLIKHLKEVQKLHIVKQEYGIYYINNNIIPIQLIITSRLTDEMNLWLRNLTDDIHEKCIADKLVKEFTPHQRENNYKSVMDAIVRANREVFTEVGIVCDALQEIIEEIAEQRAEERVERKLAERLEKEVTERAEKLAGNKICSLVRRGLLKMEDAANELGITTEELEERMKNVEILSI